MLRTILLFLVPFLLITFNSKPTNAKSTFWQSLQSPILGDSESIGGYSNGCIIGAKALPLNSPYYQVLRSNKNRFYGHPSLMSFIENYSEKANQNQLGIILVGDMGMPAGGRFNGGHASHQSGLDVDIWLQLPKKRWQESRLNDPQPIDLVNQDGGTVNKTIWNEDIFQMIKLAAQDPTVSRVFVNAAIKQHLCNEESSNQENRKWLRKIRPWFQHRAHMHVRLTCSIGDVYCENQPMPPAGDGCGDELASWFTSSKGGENSKDDPNERTPVLPKQCQNIVSQYQG